MTVPVAITPLDSWIAAKIGGHERPNAAPVSPLSLEALESYQLAKLNETLSLVRERSRFYDRLLEGRDTSLSSLHQLADLPFTTPDDLRSAPLDLVCVPPDEVERIVTLPTSGTTGPPKRVYFTCDDQELTRDFFHWGMSTLVEPGDRVLILLPGEAPGSVGDLLREGLARMDVEGIPHGPVSDPQRTLEVMQRERATALVGIPVQVLGLARLSAGRRRVELRSVLLSTDRVPHVVAGTIEQTWGCAVYNHYGSTEMGLGGGVDCSVRSGYHLREADLYFEVVDPLSGRPVADGETGEVVFTTLTRTAMPLVRYRTGDLSRFVTEPCPCGTILRRLAHIDERILGGVTLRGGAFLRQRDLDEALFALPDLADFRVLFGRGRTGDTLVVRVRLCEGSTSLSPEAVSRALNAIPSLGAEIAGGTVSLEVQSWQTGESGGRGTGKRTIEHLQGAM
ncbi:MAG: phenylacetate--CoA ligase family protein [Thermoleophilia bacterium]|nr:phenylacetate--CoA ligase family protein [Thermoleophilia bacterium]